MERYIPDNTKEKFNKKLTTKLFTLGDLRIYLLFRYGTYKFAGIKVGLSSSRVRQMVLGYALPETPEIIRKLSEDWEIDAIILTQLFDRYRGRYKENDMD